MVSARDIEVEVSYVNNSAARYPQIKGSGIDIYYNAKLSLTSGSTTIHGILEQTGISFDNEPTQYTIVQDGKEQSKNQIGINLMIFVDGECRGIYAYNDNNRGSDIPLQLHDGEKVSIVRIPSGFYVLEASSGDDSTAKFMSLRVQSTKWVRASGRSQSTVLHRTLRSETLLASKQVPKVRM